MKLVEINFIGFYLFLFYRVIDSFLLVNYCCGHIGYSIKPDERRKGYATSMLKAILPYCKDLGLDKILITCIDGNIGSEKAILNNGGVYETTVNEPDMKRKLKRFWIAL